MDEFTPVGCSYWMPTFADLPLRKRSLPDLMSLYADLAKEKEFSLEMFPNRKSPSRPSESLFQKVTPAETNKLYVPPLPEE